jgi:glycosyltransferase involved in cell wall biosynthesis
MRILVLCYEYPPIGGGGGRVARSIAEGLAARGHEVRVQTAALGWRSERAVESGVEIIRSGSGRRLPDTCTVLEMGLYLATSLWPAWALCRTWRPEVIHTHFAMPTGVLAWVLHGLTRVPYVLTAHLGDVPGGVPEQTDRLFRLVGWLARLVWRGAAGATAVSDFVRQLAERAYARPVRKILNGVDLDGRPARPLVLSGEVPHLIFLGRFNRQKNAPLLVEALARLTNLSWKVTLIGDGPDMAQVRELVAAHGLGARVQLVGWRSSAEVGALLAEADVLCMPSSSEGMPVAAVEALRYGLAIAGTDIPGLRDVLEEGVNGLIAPVDDVAGYAAIVRALLENPARLLAMRQASWEKAEEFSLGMIVEAYEEVLAGAKRDLPGT